jgi:hypothetical protein
MLVKRISEGQTQLSEFWLFITLLGIFVKSENSPRIRFSSVREESSKVILLGVALWHMDVMKYTGVTGGEVCEIYRFCSRLLIVVITFLLEPKPKSAN